MKLIDKDAVLAEIEKRIVEYKDMKIDSSYYEGMVASLEFFRDEFINTLEAKEVDYDKVLTEYLGNFENASIGHRLSIRRTAKHFFELGLKAQKGE